MNDPLTQLPAQVEPASRQPGISPEERSQRRKLILTISIVVILIVGILGTGLFFLLSPGTDASTVSRIRDVFIIVMALESLLIGAVLIILVLQLAQLTNLIQHEIKPILDSTNETISTLRGTTEFLSNNLAEPVIKINEYAAALQRLFEIFGIGRRSS